MFLSKSTIDKIESEIQRVLIVSGGFKSELDKNNFIDVCRIWLSISPLQKQYDFFYDGIKIDKAKLSNMVCPDKIFPNQPALRYNVYEGCNTIVNYICMPNFLDFGNDNLVLCFSKKDKEDFLSKLKVLKKDVNLDKILENFKN